LAKYQNSGLGQLLSASQNTINITGAQGTTSHPWHNLTTSLSLNDLDWTEPHVKKYQVLEIEEDLLALSCAWQRLRKAVALNSIAYVSISKITDVALFKHLTQADHDKAKMIRDYYSKKIMMWTLKEQKLSKFREDMNMFIHSNGKVFKEDMCPLAYRLPEFYDYDIEFDELTMQHNKKIDNKDQANGKKELSLKKTFVVGKKFNKRKEYWYSDENSNLVCLSFSHDNPLLSLLDLHSEKPIRISTSSFAKKHRDNVEYLVPNKFKFA
jgi:hypothetical protein